MRADGRIAGAQHALDRPVGRQTTACAQHRPQRVLQAEAQLRAPADVDVGEQAEHRPTPIGARPGVRAVETLVAGLRHAARHGAQLLGPHVRLAAVAGLHTCHALDVDRQPFRQPGMLLAGVGQGEMRHLVHQHPVRIQLCVGDGAAGRDADVGGGISEGLAAGHTLTRHGEDAQRHRVGREATVVGGDDRGGALHPGDERLRADAEVAFVEVDVESCAGGAYLGHAGGARARAGNRHHEPGAGSGQCDACHVRTFNGPSGRRGCASLPR
jgi:hypothetical protein